MDVKKIKKPKGTRQLFPINLRVTEEAGKWLEDKKYSPTALFKEAMKDLGYKGE